MVAIQPLTIQPLTAPPVTALQRRPTPSLEPRPQLRLLQGGLSPKGGADPFVRLPSSVYRRRRVAAAVLVVALVVGAAIGALAGLQVLAGSPGGGSLTAPAAANSPGAAPSVRPSSVSPGATSVVVGPGDTLWSIARQVTPAGGDVAATVDRLVARNGGVSLLEPGMRLAVD